MNKINGFDCVLCVAGKDHIIIKRTIKQIKKNINPDKIYVITKREFFVVYKLLGIDSIILLDEDKVIPGVTFAGLQEIILKRGGDGRKAGWYLQQFLKMGFANSSFSSDYYLVWDADTLPVRPIQYFENGNPTFVVGVKDHHYEPYFVTMRKMLNLEKQVDFSFISENMIIDCRIMRQLITALGDANYEGNNWTYKILNAIDQKDLSIGFSEFETYGNYTMKLYPEKYKVKYLKTWREAGYKYGRLISDHEIDSLGKEFDMISLEPWMKPGFWRKSFQFPLIAFIYFSNKFLSKIS